jgi:hypothetical protein
LANLAEAWESTANDRSIVCLGKKGSGIRTKLLVMKEPWLCFQSRLSLIVCEFMIVAFRSAKVASVIATFAEQKATFFVAHSINSQPIRERSENTELARS